MPDLASLAYGDEFITDISLSNQLCLSAWALTPEPKKHPNMRRFTYCNTPAAPVNFEKLEVSEWPENRDPLTQFNLLDREEEQLQDLILRFKTSLSFSCLESLANRLVTLFRDAKETDATSPGITLGSLRNFYNFLQLHANIKCPTISLTPEDNLYASWRIEKNQLFSVHFLQNGDTRFVIFKPNSKHPERQIRISGTATTDILKETVAPYGVWDWISEWKVTEFLTNTTLPDIANLST